MYKRLLALALGVLLALVPATALAKGFSGGRSSSFRSGGYAPSTGYVSSGYKSGSTYHSGYRSASPSVRARINSSGYNQPAGARTGGSRWLGPLAGFGAGMLVGSLLHPFGGFYGGGYHPFSLAGLLIDLLILGAVLWLASRLLRGVQS